MFILGGGQVIFKQVVMRIHSTLHLTDALTVNKVVGWVQLETVMG